MRIPETGGASESWLGGWDYVPLAEGRLREVCLLWAGEVRCGCLRAFSGLPVMSTGVLSGYRAA